MTLRHGRRRRDGHERLGLLIGSCAAFPVDAVGVVGGREDDGTCTNQPMRRGVAALKRSTLKNRPKSHWQVSSTSARRRYIGTLSHSRGQQRQSSSDGAPRKFVSAPYDGATRYGKSRGKADVREEERKDPDVDNDHRRRGHRRHPCRNGSQ